MSKESKVDAFRSYNFDEDSKWQSYVRTIELPGVDAVAALQRVKAKWYKREVDQEFEIEWVANAPVKPASQPFTSRAVPPQQQQSAPPPPRSTPSSSTSNIPPPNSWRSSTQTNLIGDESTQLRIFAMHVLLLLCAVFHTFPVLPISSCSLRCYTWFMRIGVFTQLYKVVTKYGAPTLYPFHWNGLMMWLQQAMSSTDFFYGMCAFSFGGLRSSVTLAMAPLLIVSVRQSLQYAAKKFSTSAFWQILGSKAYAWISSRSALLDTATTWCEVALGFLVVGLLITPNRNFMLVFFYWNMLKMRFLTPESSAAHRQVWYQLDNYTKSYRANFPYVNPVIQWVQNWFNTIPGAR
ncbi:hypothetical protein CEUSTIGMA_g5299.t1 [Chlamydomonas eustigma]|uniref:Uncharacterized protein n=1 Tax=Chlamydomonas eustigma TaxID=1157962 RepID=A0A250X447_9CHLO|nr:hypothetical protein CEUSTIGMA_g5299.t1 [Chlamydomonas eustigma]|eukprot:GAX77857.1 hypothetical protein CEUSTIGMA_g5299.t1 [Chlamydomonas eustigma]